jgi:hypothetical protein
MTGWSRAYVTLLLTLLLSLLREIFKNIILSFFITLELLQWFIFFARSLRLVSYNCQILMHCSMDSDLKHIYKRSLVIHCRIYLNEIIKYKVK